MRTHKDYVANYESKTNLIARSRKKMYYSFALKGFLAKV